jgi:dienelactone hydrolase
MRTHLVAVLVVSSAASVARADCPPPAEEVFCGPYKGVLRDYVHIEDPPLSDTRASNTDCGHEVRLRGWWFKPTGPAPDNGYPLLVYSHGSEDLKEISNRKSAKCTIVEPLVAKGVAVFVPHRRGHGKSTGMYYELYRGLQSAVDCVNDPQNCAVYRREATMSYLHQQALDVQLAALVASQYPAVNPKKVSLMGHSFGAMVTMFANEIDVGQKAVVNFAGGGESWDGDPCNEQNRDDFPLCEGNYEAGVLQDYLYRAAEVAKAPIFFFDTNHDVSVEPVFRVPFHTWKNDSRDRWQVTLYGPVNGLSCEFPDSDGKTVSCRADEEPTKPCPADPATGEIEMCGNVAHAAFANDPDQIARWMPAVLEFLKRHRAR